MKSLNSERGSPYPAARYNFSVLLLCSKCLLTKSVQSVNETLLISKEMSTKPEFIFNQLIDYVPSNPTFYSIVLNVILSLLLIQANLKEQGCQLPNGIHIPNGWQKLVNTCQEKCFCEENEYYCIPNACDLSKNQCISDEFGDSCQGAVLVLHTQNTPFKTRLINLNGNRSRKILPLIFPSGEFNTDINFEIEEGLYVTGGCGSTLMGEFWYLGGRSEYSARRQVSRISGFYLELS